MPCDQIILNSVELGKMNGVLLGRALAALGAVGVSITTSGAYFTLDGVRCRIAAGKLTVQKGSEHLADKIKRSYSAEVVKYTAKKQGWTLKKTEKPFVFEVLKG